MRECRDPVGVNARLRDWFARPLGRSLLALEMHQLREILARLYGPVALQVGCLGKLDMIQASAAALRMVLDHPPLEGAAPQIIAQSEALPFAPKSVDVLLLPHTLDFDRSPHAALREAQRVLAPEGYVVVIGFNPISLWGVWRLVVGWRGRIPWCGRFYSLVRIKDWLYLLGFQIENVHRLYFRPPVTADALRDRLYFLERAGGRAWPVMAAVYVVIARKTELGVTPIVPAWKRRRAVAPGLADPVARNMRRG